MTKIRAFITHKPAEKFEDCQDSFAISKENKAIAIADGVSRSMFPKEWADLLTKKFVANKSFSLESRRIVDKLRTEWWQFFKEELQRQKDIQWKYVSFTEEAYNDKLSAGATLAGIRLNEKNQRKQINYEVLGDSCIIVIKDGVVKEQISSKPEGAEFDNYPDYLDSNSKIGQRGQPRKGQILRSDCDQIFLVTDALSDKFNEIRNGDDKGKSLIDEINKLSNHEDFEKFVAVHRSNGMSCDDTTLIIVELDKKSDFKILYQTPLEQYILDEKNKNKQSCTPQKVLISALKFLMQ